MKVINRLLRVAMILIICINILPINTFAARPRDDDSVGEAIWGTITQGFGYWIQDDTDMDIDIELGNSGAESSSVAITERIFGTIQVVGSVMSVIALLIIGFRYMFSSLEEKAAMKGILIYYVIGAVLVFATSNILSVVYNLIIGITI